jgi:hypothetical protein
MPTLGQAVRVVAPHPAYIAPATTIPQPNLGPKVGPVPLFSTSKPTNRSILKNPLFYVAIAVVGWYFLG